jgi:inorganic pyrophosphatase
MNNFSKLDEALITPAYDWCSGSEHLLAGVLHKAGHMAKTKRNLSELDPIDEEHDAINVIIETSRGARTKLAYDPDAGTFVAKKILPQGMSFPFDFGFIPSTTGGDGDPLDVLLLIDEPVPAGTLVPARLIGVIEATQTERDGSSMENHRLIAVATISELFADVKRFDDLPDAVMSQIEHFFISYNEQAGKHFEPTDRSGARRARTLVDKAIRRHAKK